MIIENTPLIKTDRLTLRKFNEDDIDALFSILSDEEVNTFLPWYPLKTYEDAKQHLIERYSNFYALDSVYRYAVCKNTDNIPIGYVCVDNSPANDFGYGLKKEYWNKGIITEASLAIIERLKRAGYLYITATHDRNNIQSGVVMKKIGMSYCYSYIEQWQPKNISVTFRMYQLNFDGKNARIYTDYWNKYSDHFIEDEII